MGDFHSCCPPQHCKVSKCGRAASSFTCPSLSGILTGWKCILSRMQAAAKNKKRTGPWRARLLGEQLLLCASAGRYEQMKASLSMLQKLIHSSSIRSGQIGSDQIRSDRIGSDQIIRQDNLLGCKQKGSADGINNEGCTYAASFSTSAISSMIRSSTSSVTDPNRTERSTSGMVWRWGREGGSLFFLLHSAPRFHSHPEKRIGHRLCSHRRTTPYPSHSTPVQSTPPPLLLLKVFLSRGSAAAKL